MKAIILAAGLGERLRPLTHGIPKPLLPVAGKPVIDYVLDQILKCKEINEVIVAVSYMADVVTNYLSKTRSGINIRTVTVPGFDTGGDLKITFAIANTTEPVLVAYGDEVTDVDVSELVKFHDKNKGLATIALFEVPKKDTDKFGIARLEGDQITEFIEKPKPEEARSNLASIGYYIMEPEAIDMIPLKKIKTEHSAFPELVKQKKLRGLKMSVSMWVDMGTITSYIKANKLAEILLPPD